MAPYVGEVCSPTASLAVSGVSEGRRDCVASSAAQLPIQESRNGSDIHFTCAQHVHVHVHGYLMHSTSHLY